MQQVADQILNLRSYRLALASHLLDVRGQGNPGPVRTLPVGWFPGYLVFFFGGHTAFFCRARLELALAARRLPW